MKQNSTSKWKDKKFKAAYNKNYREDQKKLKAMSPSAILEQTITDPNARPVSPWKLKSLERKAKEEAGRAHPMGLEECPFCGAAFFRKVNDKYEPIEMDHCDSCAKRFYFYNGVKS